MSLITNKQQQLIDLLIANHIKTYDKLVLQYLKLRQDLYEDSNRIFIDLVENKDLSDSNLIRLKKLQLEYEKLFISYRNNLVLVKNSIESKKNISSLYIQTLEPQYDSLTAEIKQLEEDIEDLKHSKKPVLDKMRAMLKDFDLNLSKRAAKKVRRIPDLAHDAKENSMEIDKNGLIFDFEELKRLIEPLFENDIESKEAESNIGASDSNGIDVERHLKDYLGSERSLRAFEEDKWIYDVSKSVETSSLSSVEEYDKTIDNLVLTINDLVNRGKESRERWSHNARKIDAIQRQLDNFENSEQTTDVKML